MHTKHFTFGYIAQSVEALCYKAEDRGFDSRCGYRIFQLTYSFQPLFAPGTDSASKRNEYQESSSG
jgi:hypothetical protein